MAAYNGQSKRIKDALLGVLQAVTYDIGFGPEPAFVQVLDNNRNVFEGTPNAQVLPGYLENNQITTGSTDKAPSYIIRIRVSMEENDSSQSTAFNMMYDLTDLVVDAINEADQHSSLTDGRPGPIGTYMLTATRGDWLIMPTDGGIELIFDINVQNTYSQNL